MQEEINEIVLHVYLPKKLEGVLKSYLLSFQVFDKGKKYICVYKYKKNSIQTNQKEYFYSKNGVQIKSQPGVFEKDSEWDWAFKRVCGKSLKTKEEITKIVEEAKNSFKPVEAEELDMQMDFILFFFKCSI